MDKESQWQAMSQIIPAFRDFGDVLRNKLQGPLGIVGLLRDKETTEQERHNHYAKLDMGLQEIIDLIKKAGI